MTERRETPLTRLARLLGGVALTRGRFAHRVLGQLLVADVTQAEYAGATLVLAAGARRNALTQAALGTAAPAIAVQGFAARQQARLERREVEVARREALVRQAAQPRKPVAGIFEALGTAAPPTLVTRALREEIEQARREARVASRERDEVRAALATAQEAIAGLQAELDATRREDPSPPPSDASAPPGSTEPEPTPAPEPVSTPDTAELEPPGPRRLLRGPSKTGKKAGKVGKTSKVGKKTGKVRGGRKR